MVRCVNAKGRVRFFPKHIVYNDPVFKNVGFWPQEEPTAPAVTAMQEALLDESPKPINNEKEPSFNDKNKAAFKSYIESVNEVETLTQLSAKYGQKWQQDIINEQLKKLNTK